MTHLCAQAGQLGQRSRHAHLLACGPHREARSPVQPVRAGREALAPAATFIELVDHHQQFVRRRLDARRQFGDSIAKDCGFGMASQAGRLVGEVHRVVKEFRMIFIGHIPMITPGIWTS